jgi:hypothetical protein
MINQLSFYYSLGKQTGKAQRQRVSTTSQFKYLTLALAVETPEDRKAARAEFDRGYRDENPPMPPSYFK